MQIYFLHTVLFVVLFLPFAAEQWVQIKQTEKGEMLIAMFHAIPHLSNYQHANYYLGN